MTAEGQENEPKKQEVGKLWREERYTDNGFASIVAFIPVLDDGTVDSERENQYIGKVQVSLGLPRPSVVAFELKVNSLASAKEQFMSNIKPAIERANAELLEQLKQEQRQRETSKKIIEVPGSAMPPPLR